jgi:hypothetical protein
LSAFTAKHYLIFSWDHGSAFGIFREQQETGLHRQSEIVIKNENVPVLTMEELNKAIRLAFGRKKVDLVVMMNCYMHFIDAAYALRNSVKYIVATETPMDFSGYNYASIFQLISAHPGVSPRKLAKSVVKSFPLKIYDNREEESVVKNQTSIFATDLKYYDLLIQQINKLVDILIPRFPTIKDDIKELRAKTFIEESRFLVDFYRFITALYESNLLKKDIFHTNLILSGKELIDFARYIPEKLQLQTTGFSIFFPKSSSPDPTKPQDTDDFFYTDFFKQTKWAELVKACNS